MKNQYVFCIFTLLINFAYLQVPSFTEFQDSDSIRVRTFVFSFESLQITGDLAPPVIGQCCNDDDAAGSGICSTRCTAYLAFSCSDDVLFQTNQFTLARSNIRFSFSAIINYDDCANHNRMRVTLVGSPLFTIATWFVANPSANQYFNVFEDPAIDNQNALLSYFIGKECHPFYGESCDQLCLPHNNFTHCDNSGVRTFCRPGYFGHNCESFNNPCDYVNCQNGGTCRVNNDGTFTCRCIVGFSGIVCEIPDCDKDSCENGVCITGFDACTCFENYEGSRCDIRSCTLSDCNFQGSCIRAGASIVCSCDRSIAYGRNCEFECPQRCINGFCVENNGVPGCLCNQGYTGTNCNILIEFEACADGNNPCENGSLCQVDSIDNQVRCSCGRAWTGQFCELPSCNIGNCVRGVCLNGEGCICEKTYGGNNCDIGRCIGEVSCLNGGRCETLRGTIGCNCQRNFAGSICGFACPYPCTVNGRCGMVNSQLLCICDNGFGGPDCSIDIREQRCAELNCQNGGICRLISTDYQCVCTERWIGASCQISTCDFTNCQNGACMRGVGCICKEEWFGVSCDQPLCARNQCSGNGRCVLLGAQRKCDCLNNYAGERCQHTCLNGCINGQCILQDGLLVCKCNTGFLGDSCQHENQIRLQSTIAFAVFLIILFVVVMMIITLLLAKISFKRQKRLELFKKGTIEQGLDTRKKEDFNLEWKSLRA